MLKIEAAHKIFNKNTLDEQVALKELNLNVSEGEFITIIGGNGAGKSTLFNIISGNMLCDDGMIQIDGMDITYMPEHKRASYIGRIFQNPMKGTAPNMTVGENLIIAYMRNMNKKALSIPSIKEKNYIKERLADLNLGLKNKLNTKIGLLSGGQRQAITLVMATLVKPKLLLLDEHTAALDPLSAAKVMEITKKIVTENKITTMMITHNVKSALDYGSRTIMMDLGEIVMDVCGEERKKLTFENLVSQYK